MWFEVLQLLRLLLTLFFSNAIVYTVLFLVPSDSIITMVTWWTLTIGTLGAYIAGYRLFKEDEKKRIDVEVQEALIHQKDMFSAERIEENEK